MSDNSQIFTKYFCPFCKNYIEKKKFDLHKVFHRNDPGVNHPETIEELKNRFVFLGMYDER